VRIFLFLLFSFIFILYIVILFFCNRVLSLANISHALHYFIAAPVWCPIDEQLSDTGHWCIYACDLHFLAGAQLVNIGGMLQAYDVHSVDLI